jgi:hypothetical protein
MLPEEITGKYAIVMSKIAITITLLRRLIRFNSLLLNYYFSIIKKEARQLLKKKIDTSKLYLFYKREGRQLLRLMSD